MRGCATTTMVASSTTISCAAAMTMSATPRWLLFRVSAWPMAEDVIAMPSMLPAGQLAVVVHRR